MDTHQRRRGVNIPEDKRDSFFLTAIGGGTGIKMAFKAHNAEVSPARGEIGLSHFVKSKVRAHASIIECTVVTSAYGHQRYVSGN